jgi:hypothetical protein
MLIVSDLLCRNCAKIIWKIRDAFGCKTRGSNEANEMIWDVQSLFLVGLGVIEPGHWNHHRLRKRVENIKRSVKDSEDSARLTWTNQVVITWAWQRVGHHRCRASRRDALPHQRAGASPTAMGEPVLGPIGGGNGRDREPAPARDVPLSVCAAVKPRPLQAKGEPPDPSDSGRPDPTQAPSASNRSASAPDPADSSGPGPAPDEWGRGGLWDDWSDGGSADGGAADAVLWDFPYDAWWSHAFLDGSLR